MAYCMRIQPSLLNIPRVIVMPAAAAPVASRTRPFYKPLRCAPPQQLQQEQEVTHTLTPKLTQGSCVNLAMVKDGCHVIFVKEKKPMSKPRTSGSTVDAHLVEIGHLLCSKCKVFKCVTFPNGSDGEELTL